MIIRCRADYIYFLSRFTARSAGRAGMNGIHIEPHHSGTGILLVTIDNHRMGIFYDRTGACTKPANIIPSRTLLLAARPRKTQDSQSKFLIIEQPEKPEGIHSYQIASVVYRIGEGCPENIRDGDSVTIGDISIDYDSKFPDYRTVIPRYDKPDQNLSVCGALNCEYLKDFSFSDHSKYIKIYSECETGPHIVQTDNPDFLGIIMPARFEPGDFIPEWMNLLPSDTSPRKVVS